MKRPVYELAKELGLPAKKLVEEIKELGIVAKSHMSTLSKEEYELVKNLFLEEKKNPHSSPALKTSEKQILKIPEGITVSKFAEKIGLSSAELIQKLIKIGIMANLNQSLGKSEICQNSQSPHTTKSNFITHFFFSSSTSRMVSVPVSRSCPGLFSSATCFEDTGK